MKDVRLISSLISSFNHNISGFPIGFSVGSISCNRLTRRSEVLSGDPCRENAAATNAQGHLQRSQAVGGLVWRQVIIHWIGLRENMGKSTGN